MSIGERLRSLTERKLEASRSEINGLKESVELADLPQCQETDRLRKIVRGWAEQSGGNTVILEPSTVADALDSIEALMRKIKSLNADSLVDFQWQKALAAQALKSELANSLYGRRCN